MKLIVFILLFVSVYLDGHGWNDVNTECMKCKKVKICKEVEICEDVNDSDDTDTDVNNPPCVCDTGYPCCTYTQGGWKSRCRLGNPHGTPPLECSNTTLCGYTMLQIFDLVPQGDAWVILAHQFAAAYLNIDVNGAICSNNFDEFMEKFDSAEQYLKSYCSTDATQDHTTPTDANDSDSMLLLSEYLDFYNNGAITGFPEHCA